MLLKVGLFFVSVKSKRKESYFWRTFHLCQCSQFCKNKVLPFYLVYLLSTTMKSSFGKDCPKDRAVVRVQTREVGLYVSLWFILSYWDMGVHDILLDRQRAGWKNPTTKKDSKIIVRTMFYFFTKLQFLEFFILEQLIKTMHFWICREKILLCLGPWPSSST